MKVKIYDTTVKILFIDYFKAKRIDKNLTECMNLIDKYNLRDRLKIEIEYNPAGLPVFAVVKYNKPYCSIPEVYDFPNSSRGYYTLNGDKSFNIDSFYINVIKPHIY